MPSEADADDLTVARDDADKGDGWVSPDAFRGYCQMMLTNVRGARAGIGAYRDGYGDRELDKADDALRSLERLLAGHVGEDASEAA